MKKLSVLLVFVAVLFTMTACTELSDPGVHYISAKSDINDLTDATIDMIVDSLIKDMSLDEKIGQMFIVDFTAFEQSKKSVKNAELSKKFKKRMQLYPVSGFIYYSWDVKTREQVISFNKELQAETDCPLFIAVDEEGGRVSRVFSNPDMAVEEIPAMATVGASADASECKKIYTNIGTELKKLGFNVDFAPVADIYDDSLGDYSSSVAEIADRSFGSDVSICSKMVSAAVKGLNSTGMIATLKHFPGMRAASSDTHIKAANVKSDIAELREVDFKPFISGIKA
ncbi:MAG: hypothetical protein K5656_00515, partial [Lachnospiraceae bacterium]|nr:hypothetical protein [Lachnospiraceae bacterium]